MVFIKKPRVNNQIVASELRVIYRREKISEFYQSGSLGQGAGSEFRLDRNIPHRPTARSQDNGLGKVSLPTTEKTERRAKKAHETGVKGVQIGLGTSLHDLEMRAKKIEEFLKEYHRVRVEMGLRGREKYMDKNFLNERLNRVLHLVSEKYKVLKRPRKAREEWQ